MDAFKGFNDALDGLNKANENFRIVAQDFGNILSKVVCQPLLEILDKSDFIPFDDLMKMADKATHILELGEIAKWFDAHKKEYPLIQVRFAKEHIHGIAEEMNRAISDRINEFYKELDS